MPKLAHTSPFRIQLVIDTELEYFRNVLLGVRHYGFQTGKLEFADRWLPHEMDKLKRLAKRDRIDGIVASINTPSLEKQLIATGCAVINVSNSLRVPRAPVVSQDDIEVGRLAARHLKECGCLSFGFIGQNKASYSDQRWIGFREILPKATSRQPIWLQSDRLTVQSYGQLRKWLKKLPKPAGIFAVLDNFALTALRAARELGLNVPEDVAILGAGDDDFQVEFEQIPLSSIRLPAREIGFVAGKHIAEILSGEASRSTSLQLPVRDISLRRSTDIQYADDSAVSKAVQLIREQPGLRVNEIAHLLGMSRTGLQRRFHKTLGRGILKEIQRVRLIRAQNLLESTSDKLEVIAEQSGFASVQRLSVCFRQAYGRSPGAYRRQFMRR